MIKIIITLFIIFLIKVIDNILSTSKTILVQKNKAFLAALSAIISSIIFYSLIDIVNNSDGDLTMYIISIASGVGTYVAIKFSDKFSKERTYVNVILSDNKKEMIKECQMVFKRMNVKENKITNLATDGYTKDWKKTIAITAYTETKVESGLLDNYINNSNNKFKRIIEKIS